MAATNKTRVSFVCMVMLSLAATLGMSVAAHGQAHGIGISHFCDGPKLVGETLDCTVQVIHNDDFGDTLSINESWVIVDPGGLDVRVPAVGNLEIIAVVGNTTAIVGGSLPVLIGPPGSTLSGLPGDPSPGVVTFAVNTYVIQPGDPDPLPTMANVVIMDLCDDPDTQGCSLIPNQVQFLAATDIIAPEISLSMDWEPFSVCQGGTTPVTYSYTVDNSGDVDLQNVLVDHDQCGPVQLVGGDNGNGILETTETWIFECTASLGVAVLSTVDVTADVVGGGPSVFDDDQFSVGTFPLGLELEESFTICEGDSAFICATPIGNPPFQWSWTGPAGFSASTQCIDVDEPGIYTVDITSNGCFVQGATEVILEPAPPCDITGPLEVCEFDDEIAYQAPPGAVNYAWSISGNGEFLFVGEGPFVTVDALGAGSFLLEVTVTDDAGCQSTCQLEVIVNPNPPCTIDGPAEACELGSTVEYSAPAGLATYAWSVNGDGFIVGPNDQQTLLVSPGSSGSFTVSLAVTDENGCFSQCNVLVPIVFCQPDIAVTKTVSDSEPFEGDEIVYTVTATNVGQESASTVDLEDVLPAGVTFVGVDFISQGTYGEIGGTWSIGSVGTGTTETLEIRVSVDPGTAGTTGTGDFIDTFVPAGSGGLSGPLGLTFGPDRNLYVSSIGTNEVLRYDDLTGNFIDAFVTAGSGGLASPVGLAFGPDGNLYVASQGTNEVLRYHGITGLFIDAFVPAGSGGLSSPVGLAFGPDGDLYVAAQATNEVYRYDGNSGAFVGVFVTAGSGGLVSPFGVRFGPDGNLYVASEGTDEILRYDGGTGAFIDAIVTAGSGGLTTPEGLTFGPDGNLYVSSEGTSSILRYDGGTGAFIDTYVLSFSGGLIFPQDLIFGPDGQLYVASITTTGEIRRYVGFITNVAFLQEIAPSDSNALNNRDSAGIDVQAVTSADLIVSKFVNNDTPGEGDQIVYTVAVFNNGPDDATGVTVDDALPAGVTFVQVDSVTQGSYDEVLGAWDVGALPNGVAAVLEIRVTVDAGTAETTGTGEFIDLFASGLDTPAGVVFDNEGNLYVSSQEGDTIYAFDSTGTPLPLVTGLELDGGAGLTIGPDGHLYACSYDNGQVVRYDVDAGAFIDVFTSGFALANPLDVVFGPDGNVYVAALGYIARYDGATGVFIDQFVPSVSIPHGLKFGPDGNLYVAKWSPGEIVRYDGTTGAFIDVFSTDGLDLPTDLQFGPDGNLYVADLTTNGVNRYDGLTGALIDTFVPSLSGGLNSPTDVAFGPDGNLYVPGLNSQVHRYQGFITNVATISAFNETDPDLLDNQASVGITVRASGACCTSGGVCQVVSENTCSNLEGVYQGDGTTCEPFPCPVKCCLPDGSCIDIHSSDCFLAGGQSEPPGSSCFSDGGPCPPVGGCCLDNDTCENLTQFGCDAVDGYYQGDDLFCGYEPCVGACCLEPSGGCQNDTPVNCAYAGGTFQGFDINCSEIVCPGEFGACCIGDFCTGTTQFDCELQGGFFAGFGTNCASDPCPRRCCLSDGSCLDTDSSDCLAQGGEPGPLGSVCDGESCGSPGACCLAGTDCQVIAEFACDAMGGVFEGGEGCGSFTCSGACCTNGGFCEVLTFFECTEYVAGLYQGNNTTCVSDPCFEACCLEGGECQDLLPADCMAMSGTPQGLGVTCATEPCPVFGACCFQTATCQDLFEDACAAAEGFFQGADTFCIDDPCPPNGACCLLDLTCIFTLAEDCAQQAGVFQGAGTVCDAGACPEPGGVLAEGKISQSSGG
ncbi:MAG: DUF11 domain-containing protein, partial [Planctomycetes bacterium]|nr:DUF11 domain-containing protein [Planctomycetota bacterium]